MMLVFVCTDLHGQGRTLVSIDRQLNQKKYDAVFMLGDLCNTHDPRALFFAEDFVDLIKKHSLPLFVVHGNQEPESVRLLFQQRGVTVHFNARQLGPYSVVGVGYGDTFPLDPDFARGKILLTHEPPRAAMIKQMVKRGSLPNAPLMHLCGHLHQLARVHEIGETLLVQVPSAESGRAAEVDLDQRKITFLRI
jgi:Icc-related predicted phosphoesterase